MSTNAIILTLLLSAVAIVGGLFLNYIGSNLHE